MNKKHIEAMAAVARVMASLGTCERLQVGAVLHDTNGRIVATGYNGVVARKQHCDHVCNCDEIRVDIHGRQIHNPGCRKDNPCVDSIHAEANAVFDAGSRFVNMRGAMCTVTHMPCAGCARTLISVGIGAVIYLNEYRSRDGVQLLAQHGVPVWSIDSVLT